MTDFFISYAQADRAWAEWIAWVLEARAYSVTIQAWDFRPGGNFVLDMQKAAAESERTIAVLSADYVQSRFTAPEWAAAFAKDPAGQKGLLIPVRVGEVELAGLLPQIIYIDLVGIGEVVSEKRLLAGVKCGRAKPPTKPIFPGRSRPRFPGGVRAEITDLPIDEIPPRGPLPAGSRMPLAFNPLFVGRQDDLRALARQLRAGDTSAIGEVQIAAASGLGGIGKTQLASEFVHRYGRFFEGGVFWMSFADPTAVPAEVAACGWSLDPYPGYDALPLAEQVRLVEEAWTQPLTRLLVFDNCEEEELLVRWRPRFGGARVLVTSRRARWDRTLGVNTVPLTILPRSVSLELLLKFRPDLPAEDSGLSGIAHELGDLPLALHLAGSFLERYAQAPFGQPAAYLESLRRGSLLEHASLQGKFSGISPTGHELNVGRTFALSLDRLKAKDETDGVALPLLARAAYFAPGEPIPRELLLKAAGCDLEEETACLLSEDALGRLVSLGLLELGEGGAVVMHRLIAEFARESESEEAAQLAVEEAVLHEANLINQEGIPGPLLAWQPHLRWVTEHAHTRDDNRAAWLCNTFAYHLKMIGDYSGALPYYERALAIRTKVLGPKHQDTARSLNNLGLLLHARGDLSGALCYYEKALSIREKALGRKHRDTASSLNNVGGVLQAKGNLSGARPYYERALAIREKVLGSAHLDTARSLNNLGGLCQAEGDLAEARTCYERALTIWEKELGPDHPETAIGLDNLGSLLQDAGDLTQARVLYERALAIRENVLGPDHPDTALSLNNLAFLLEAEGNLMAARSFYERAVAIFEKRFGSDHARTKVVRRNLAALARAS